MEKIIKYLGFLLFFLMVIVLPQVNIIKTIIISILIISWLILITKDQSFISKETFIIVLIIFLRGFLGVTYGITKGNDDVQKYIVFNTIWPIVFLIFVSLIRKHGYIKGIINVLILGHIFNISYDIYIMIGNYLNFSTITLYPGENVFSIYDTFTHFNLNNINPLIFTYPFLIVIFFYWKTQIRDFILYPKWIINLLMIITPIFFLLTGRRMMLFTIIITPITIFMLRNKYITEGSRHNILRKFVFIASIGIAFSIFLFKFIDVDISGVFLKFNEAFSSTAEPLKFQQASLLWNSFLTSPLIGHGIGYTLYEPYRQTYSASFELSYLSDLNTTGLLGGIMIFSAYLYVGFKIYRIYKSRNDIIALALLLGYVNFLIANTTNPFLSSYDYLWPLYIVIAYVNFHDLNKTYLPYVV